MWVKKGSQGDHNSIVLGHYIGAGSSDAANGACASALCVRPAVGALAVRAEASAAMCVPDGGNAAAVAAALSAPMPESPAAGPSGARLIGLVIGVGVASALLLAAAATLVVWYAALRPHLPGHASGKQALLAAAEPATPVQAPPTGHPPSPSHLPSHWSHM